MEKHRGVDFFGCRMSFGLVKNGRQCVKATIVGDNSAGRWEDKTKPTPNFRPSLAIFSKVCRQRDAEIVSSLSLSSRCTKLCASSSTMTVGIVSL
jgi:hypothetical protein